MCHVDDCGQQYESSQTITDYLRFKDDGKSSTLLDCFEKSFVQSIQEECGHPLYKKLEINNWSPLLFRIHLQPNQVVKLGREVYSKNMSIIYNNDQPIQLRVAMFHMSNGDKTIFGFRNDDQLTIVDEKGEKETIKQETFASIGSDIILLLEPRPINVNESSLSQADVKSIEENEMKMNISVSQVCLCILRNHVVVYKQFRIPSCHQCHPFRHQSIMKRK